MDIWPNRKLLVVSIGTGAAPGKAFKGNIKRIIDGMQAILTQTERTASDFHLRNPSMAQEKLLFRFNVIHGLAEVGLEEHKETGKIADATQSYVDTGEAGDKLKECVQRLMGVPLQGIRSQNVKSCPVTV